MNARAQKSEAERLREIRDSLAAIAPGEWTRAADDVGELIEARDTRGEPVIIARYQPGAGFDERVFMADAPETVRFLLGLVDRAIEKARAQAADRRPSDGSDAPAQGQPRSGDAARERNYSAEAAMKCQEPAFKAFLEERHGLERPLTDERAAQKLRGLLGVTSRREINAGGVALERWKAIRAEFNEWRTAG